MQQLTGLLNI